MLPSDLLCSINHLCYCCYFPVSALRSRLQHTLIHSFKLSNSDSVWALQIQVQLGLEQWQILRMNKHKIMSCVQLYQQCLNWKPVLSLLALYYITKITPFQCKECNMFQFNLGVSYFKRTFTKLELIWCMDWRPISCLIYVSCDFCYVAYILPVPHQ